MRTTWFVAWECGCTATAHDPAEHPYRCPTHDLEPISGPEREQHDD